MNERRIQTIIGTAILAVGILITALEHVDFIWSHVPKKYADMIDTKVLLITILAGFVVLLLRRPPATGYPTTSDVAEEAESVTSKKPKPNLVLLDCKESYLAALKVGGLLLAFRNDVLTFRDSARGVIAHISYAGPDGARREVNYGMWVEAEDYLTFDRSDTRHLIIALKEGTELIAVENIAPQTNYQEHQMVEVGTLTPGEWALRITLTAENYRQDYSCKLIVASDGGVKCAMLRGKN